MAGITPDDMDEYVSNYNNGLPTFGSQSALGQVNFDPQMMADMGNVANPKPYLPGADGVPQPNPAYQQLGNLDYKAFTSPEFAEYNRRVGNISINGVPMQVDVPAMNQDDQTAANIAGNYSAPVNPIADVNESGNSQDDSSDDNSDNTTTAVNNNSSSVPPINAPKKDDGTDLSIPFNHANLTPREQAIAAYFNTLQKSYNNASDADDEIKAAKAYRQRANNIGNIGDAIDRMVTSRSVAYGGPGANDQYWNNLQEQGQVPVDEAHADRQAAIQDYMNKMGIMQSAVAMGNQNAAAQQNADMNDPNSDISNRTWDAFNSIYPDIAAKIPKGTVSASQIQGLFGAANSKSQIDSLNNYREGMLEKTNSVNDINSKLKQNELDNQTIGSEVSKNKIANFKARFPNNAGLIDENTTSGADVDSLVKQMISQQNGEARTNAKDEGALDKQEIEMNQKMDPTVARAGLKGEYARKVFNAQQAYSLIYNDDGSIKDLAPEFMGEATAKWAAMINNGNATTDYKLESLTPNYIGKEPAKIAQWITGDPTGTGQQKFLQVMANSITAEKNVADNYLKQAQVSTAGNYPKLQQQRPEAIKRALLKNGIDPSQVDKNGRFIMPSMPGPKNTSQEGTNKAGSIINYQGSAMPKGLYKVGSDGETLTSINSQGSTGSW